MSVTFDNKSNSGTFSAVTSIFWNHTTTSADTGIGHYNLVTVSAYGTPTAKWGSSSGSGGTAMAEIAGGPSQYNDGTIYCHATLFFITNSSLTISGTQEISMSWGRNGFGALEGSTWLNGDQTTPLNNPVYEGSGGANSALTVTSATGNQVLDAFVGDAGSANFTQTKTSIAKVGAGSQTGSAQYDSGAATVTMNMTHSSVQHAHIAAQIQVASGGGAAPEYRLMFLGVS